MGAEIGAGGTGARETPGSRVGGAGTRLLTGGGGAADILPLASLDGTPGGRGSESALGADAGACGDEACGDELATGDSSTWRGVGGDGGALGRLRTGGGGGVLFGPGLLETGFDRTGGGGGIDLPERGVGFLDELSSAI